MNMNKVSFGKDIGISEFRDSGLLQEVNRQFFHPRGLSLELVYNPDETLSIGGITDYSNTIVKFPPEYVASPSFLEKAERIRDIMRSYRDARIEVLGAAIQPIPGFVEEFS